MKNNFSLLFLNLFLVATADSLAGPTDQKVAEYKRAYERLRQEYSLERVSQEKIEVTWDDLLGMATPLSNRIAVQERHHSDVVFVQPEMTVALGREDDSWGIGFALGNPLQFPDFHENVRQKLHRGYQPIAESVWQTDKIAVEQTAFAFLPFDEEVVTGKEKQYTAIQLRVRNRTDSTQTADLLVLICPHLDGTQNAGILYEVFTAPVSRWQKEPLTIQLQDHVLRWNHKILLAYHCDPPIPAIFYPVFIPKVKTKGQPDRLTNCLQFTVNLAPHETRTLDFILPSSSKLCPESERELMAEITFASALKRASEHWDNALKPAMKFAVPEERLNRIYRQAILGCLQHVTQNPGLPWREPLQTLTTSMVWPWEAADMIVPLLSIGLHRELEPCLRYFTLRQVRVGPYSADEAVTPHPLAVKLWGPLPQRPDGDIKSAKGAYIGLNPYWMNETGSVLRMLAAYYRYTRDEVWLNHNAPSILAAWDFIQNARNQTRLVKENGEKVDHYGLMPKGRVHDWGGWRYHYSFTDNWTWEGMTRMAQAFAQAQRPEAERMKAEAEEYRRIILRLIDKMQFVDPETGILFIPNTVYYRQGPEHRGGVWLGDGPAALFATGLLPATDDRFNAMVDYIKRTTGFLMGLSMSFGGTLWYVNSNELGRFTNYLDRGEFEKALLVFYSNLVYGLSHDTLQAVERIDILNEDFAPLQPNASGNGRYINMLRQMIIDERDPGKLWLLRGCPRRWFAAGKEIRVTDIPTLFGKMAVRTQSDGQTIVVDIDAPDGETPNEIRLVVHHPQGKFMNAATVNGKEARPVNNVIVLTNPVGHLTVSCAY